MTVLLYLQGQGKMNWKKNFIRYVAHNMYVPDCDLFNAMHAGKAAL